MKQPFIPESVAMSQEVRRLNDRAEEAMNLGRYGLAGMYQRAAVEAEACIENQRLEEARDRATQRVKQILEIQQ